MSKDIRIHPTAILNLPELVTMGDHIAIDPFFYMTTQGVWGSYIHIGSHVSVIGGSAAKLILGSQIAISTGCRLICRSDDFTKRGSAVPFAVNVKRNLYGWTIMIGDYAIIGANTVILPDVTIGEGAVVGAQSLVKTDCDPWGIYAGIPARKIGERYEN